MSGIFKINNIFALIFALILSACSDPESYKDAFDKYPVTANSSPQMLEINSDGAMNGKDTDYVQRFARKYLRSGEGDLAIAVPDDVGLNGRAQEVERLLLAEGVARERIVKGHYVRRSFRDGIILSFSTSRASGPFCDDRWDEDAFSSSGSQKGFGCATQNNLAVMIAHPRDIAIPRASTPPDMNRIRTIFDKYRKDELPKASASTISTR